MGPEGSTKLTKNSLSLARHKCGLLLPTVYLIHKSILTVLLHFDKTTNGECLETYKSPLAGGILCVRKRMLEYRKPVRNIVD